VRGREDERDEGVGEKEGEKSSRRRTETDTAIRYSHYCGAILNYLF
jgi:hypothetical protein